MFARSTCRSAAVVATKNVAFTPKYPTKLPTQRAFWEKQNKGALSSCSPLLMFTLWHQSNPAVSDMMNKSAKGELYSFPVMEKLFNEAPKGEQRKFYVASHQLQKELSHRQTGKKRNGYNLFQQEEGSKPSYNGLSYRVQSVMLAKAWWKLPEARRQAFRARAIELSQ